MTVLAAVAAGPGSRVLAFEPHPELFAVLERNVADARRHWSAARVDTYRARVGRAGGLAACTCRRTSRRTTALPNRAGIEPANR
jgi:hypothetical protein